MKEYNLQDFANRFGYTPEKVLASWGEVSSAILKGKHMMVNRIKCGNSNREWRYRVQPAAVGYETLMRFCIDKRPEFLSRDKRSYLNQDNYIFVFIMSMLLTPECGIRYETNADILEVMMVEDNPLNESWLERALDWCLSQGLITYHKKFVKMVILSDYCLDVFNYMGFIDTFMSRDFVKNPLLAKEWVAACISSLISGKAPSAPEVNKMLFATKADYHRVKKDLRFLNFRVLAYEECIAGRKCAEWESSYLGADDEYEPL